MLDKIIHKYLKIPYTLHLASKRRPRKPKATVIFLHGIGRSGAAWDDVIKLLPDDIAVLSVDLLGFGKSPRPSWAEYNAKNHARSVRATLLKTVPRRPLIIVGHSLGSLVAVEMARRYSNLFDELILCSPPFYREDTTRIIAGRDDRLKKIYKLIHNNPERFLEATQLAARYKLTNGPINVTGENLGAYMSALEATIINQTSLEDAKKLRTPMRIIHGALDPLVIKKNLKHLAKHNERASLRTITAGHEVNSKTYTKAVSEEIQNAIQDIEKRRKDKSKRKPSPVL